MVRNQIANGVNFNACLLKWSHILSYQLQRSSCRATVLSCSYLWNTGFAGLVTSVNLKHKVRIFVVVVTFHAKRSLKFFTHCPFVVTFRSCNSFMKHESISFKYAKFGDIKHECMCMLGFFHPLFLFSLSTCYALCSLRWMVGGHSQALLLPQPFSVKLWFFFSPPSAVLECI